MNMLRLFVDNLATELCYLRSLSEGLKLNYMSAKNLKQINLGNVGTKRCLILYLRQK